MAFLRRADTENFLVTANLDGSDERQIASFKGSGGFRAADWSPDGKTIAYGMSPFLGDNRARSRAT